MSDITGNAFTIHAAEKIEKAIEHVGYTSSQQQVGKGISAKVSATGTEYNARGAVLCADGDDKEQFLGVVKAACCNDVNARCARDLSDQCKIASDVHGGTIDDG